MIKLKSLILESSNSYWWMDTNGKLYPCGMMHHNTWALQYIHSNPNIRKKGWESIENIYEIMYNMGWLRVCLIGYHGDYEITYNHSKTKTVSNQQIRELKNLAIESNANELRDDTMGKRMSLDESYYDDLSDDERTTNADNYFDIGQNDDMERYRHSCWYWNGNDIISKKGGAHGSNFSHDVTDKTFKGWYDVDKNTISVVFPSHELRKLGNKRPTVDDIPEYLYKKLNSKFGKPKANIMVFESIIKENLTYKQLLAVTDDKRKERAKTVRARSIPVSVENGNESWNFRYKSNPSVTNKPFQGSIQFLKEVKNSDNAEDLDCKVDCSCKDYTYRWSYNNSSKNAGDIGINTLNKNNGRRPQPAYDEGHPGLCKHLCSLSSYLKTKILSTKKSNLFESMNDIIKEGNFNISY